MFEEKELTLEELISDLNISKKSYDKLSELNLLDYFKLMLRNDNDISICYSDLKNVFKQKEIVGYIHLDKEKLIIDIFENYISIDNIVLFLFDKEIEISIIDNYKMCINTELNYDAIFLFGFKKSVSKKLIGLIVGNGI